MEYARQLLLTASKLLEPRELEGKILYSTDCNRAVSTAYYALFDALCTAVADYSVAQVVDVEKRKALWEKIYRSIDHKFLKDNLKNLKSRIPANAKALKFLELAFERLQDARTQADYIRGQHFNPVEAGVLVREAERAVEIVGDLLHNIEIGELIFEDLAFLLYIRKRR
jgi:hypothetical protein